MSRGEGRSKARWAQAEQTEAANGRKGSAGAEGLGERWARGGNAMRRRHSGWGDSPTARDKSYGAYRPRTSAHQPMKVVNSWVPSSAGFGLPG